MTNRKYSIFGVGALILIALWLTFSPHYTLVQMKNSIEARDANALNEYIDYDALRSNLKEQIAAKAGAEIAKGGADAVGAAFAQAMAGPMIDALVQPAMITGMLAGEGNKSPAPNAKIMGDDIRIKRTGLRRFVVTSKDDNGGPVFEMRGFGWKMVGIDLGE